MPQIVIKATRDRDLYLIWSTVVDAPVAIGTRDEAAEWLRNEHRRTPDEAEVVLQRTDANGSSDRSVKFGWWDDDTLMVVSGAPYDGWYHIRRDRLADYADALLRDDDAAAQALLECYERHDEDNAEADR